MLKLLFQILVLALPWPLRRRALCAAFGFEIAPTARIGISLFFIKHLRLEAHARIGHLNLVRGLRLLHVGECGSIGNLNWVSALPAGHPVFFTADTQRDPCLIIGHHAALTHRHMVDCTDSVSLGEFTTFAGWRSQILTHSIDLRQSRQRAQPVKIGDYCFIGTGVIILPGAALPDRSVLGAGSVLTGAMDLPNMIYAGIPAMAVRELDAATGYFVRSVGFIV
jgi:serine acetyltransferase